MSAFQNYTAPGHFRHTARLSAFAGLDSSQWSYLLVRAALIFIAVYFLVPFEAFAQSAPALVRPPGTCTFDPQFQITNEALIPGQGIISRIVWDIRNVIESTINPMYYNILERSSFSRVVAVMLTLYIAIYGVLFTFGMVQVTVYDFFMRMLKFSVIAGFVIADTDWWMDFLRYLIDFFVDGTDAIIAFITSIPINGVAVPYTPERPFASLDALIANVLSARMLVTLLATAFTGGYGIVILLLLALSLGSLLRVVMSAVWIYLMGLVLKMLLLALSPIFISFLLFDRTRHLFDGWLNQLVNACLQPIFVFVFLAFFISLLQVSLENIMRTPVCWTEWVDSVRGTPFAVHFWRFAVRNSAGEWEPYSGPWSFTGIPGANNSPVFPIDILAVLIFLFLAQLAGRFNSVVVMIANEIASASTNLSNFQGPLSDWFSGATGASGGGAAGRAIPGVGASAASAVSKAGQATQQQRGMVGRR